MNNAQEIAKNIQAEMSKIDSKTNKILFFVIDTKGVPSGSLKYIYNLALMLKEDGYDVSMLHTEDEFVGVQSWLGDRYANLPHYNINKEKINTSPSDILFIPDIYAQVMNQTRNLPCKRIAILQNYDYVVEQMPYAAQWGTFGIMDAITNSDAQQAKLHEVFPYVKITKITPFIGEEFVPSDKKRNLVVNVIAKSPNDIPKIVKPFYWKYPLYKWVSFKDIRGLSTEDFAKALQEAAVTIVADDTMSFGYSALDSMASGCLTMVKVPEVPVDWMSKEETYPNCCIWFDSYDLLHKQLATIIRAELNDNVPEVLADESKKICAEYTKEKTHRQLTDYISNILANRKQEMENLLKQVENNANNNNE